MPPVGFEPTISAGERPKNCALDRAATGTGTVGQVELNNIYIYIYMGANNGSEKLLTETNTATSGKLVKAVYA